MQEYLNAEDGCLWGIVSNGSKLRVLRDNSSLTRPTYIEADLDVVFAEELYPDFAALWLAAHASRFTPTNSKPSGCIIEGWRAKAMRPVSGSWRISAMASPKPCASSGTDCCSTRTTTAYVLRCEKET